MLVRPAIGMQRGFRKETPVNLLLVLMVLVIVLLMHTNGFHGGP
jgi:hypothetical protein